MYINTRMMVPAAALTLALSSTPLLAQEPAPMPEPAPEVVQAQQAQSMDGELLRVDVDANRFWIRADGEERQFTFTPETEIVGEGRSVEGLATMTGTRVTVAYTAEGNTAVATKIEIHAGADDPQPAPEPAPQQ